MVKGEKLDIYSLDRENKEEVNRFIEENINLVRKIVHKLKRPGLEFDDLLQEGLIGLYQAIMNFDTSTGYQFSTYAYPMIAGTIQRYIRDKGNVIRIPRRVYDIYFKYLALTQYYEHNDIVKQLELSEKEIKEIEKADLILNNYGLDMVIFEGDSGSITLQDTLSSSADIESEVLGSIEYNNLLNIIERKMGDRGGKVAKYKQEGYTQKEISERIGTSQTQVSRDLAKMKNILLNCK